MSAPASVFLSLGSNIQPKRHLMRCLEMLRACPESCVSEHSSWYRTRPWGIEQQPEFINLVVGMQTSLGPLEFLAATQAIEVALGRERSIRNGPRTIDIDILLFGNRVLSGPQLSVPHPGILERDFMLVPLLEVAPDAVHPGLGQPFAALTDRVRYRQIIERIEPGSTDHAA